jgi:ribosomal protein S18 acetylase RimI-like enzyme
MTLVREMTADDLQPVSELAEQLVKLHHGWDTTRFFITKDIAKGYRWYFNSLLDDAESLLLVAEVDGVIAGYLYGSVEERDWAKLLDAHGAIHDLFVAESHRKHGVARALMNEARTRLQQKGARQLVLYSASANAQGQALFRALGYRPTMVEMTMDLTAPGAAAAR